MVYIRIFDAYFQMHVTVCLNDAPGFLIFAYEMLCHLSTYIGYESGGYNLKVTGDVAT